MFKPLDRLALIGNDLSLPEKRDGHEAHGDNAKNENEANAGLVSREAENAPKPIYGKESPSTRVHRLVDVRANPRR